MTKLPSAASFALVVLATRPGLAAIAKGPWVQRVTSATATVKVEVVPPGPATLEVSGPGDAGAAFGPETRRIESPEARALHAISVEHLRPATRYTYRVRVADGVAQGAFTTAAPDAGDAAFRFVIYGDNRTDDVAHQEIVKAIVPVAPDFLVHTGDFVAVGGSAAQWTNFFNIEAPLLRERPLFGCIGNHELAESGGREFARYFGLADLPSTREDAPVQPEQLAGTFRWSNARFFLLNGMVPYRSGPDRRWLDAALAAADGEPGLVWRIVVVHHGPWSSGPHGDNRLLHEAHVPELLRAHKVDLVVSGHDHIYERGSAEGMPYLVSGGGGAPTYGIAKPKLSARRYESVRHIVLARASASAIDFVTTRIDGSSLERCSLGKGIGWMCDGPRNDTASPITASGPTASSSPSSPSPAAARSRCDCLVAGAGGARSEPVTVLLVATGLLGASGRCRGRSRRGKR